MVNITKRNGDLVPFDITRIERAIQKAFLSCGVAVPEDTIKNIAKNVEIWEDINVEEIQDQVVELLHDWNYGKVAEEYVIYRHKRATIRESKAKEVFLGIINTENNDVTRENANMNSDSPAGMMMKFASETTKPFVDNYLLSKEVLEAVRGNYIHIHDKDYYPTKSLTCVQTPLDKILHNGFRSGHGESRGAKRIETAATLACISMETTQNEQHGGQAIPAFDFYMAPFVRETYKEEVNKIRDLLVDGENEEYWDNIRNAEISDYTIQPLPTVLAVAHGFGGDGIPVERIKQAAINNTVKRVHQAMEGFIHNMNQIHSRGGNQVVFSSINYGTDTSAEGRCVMRELLLSTERGVGNGATAIFPIQIFKVKDGVSHKPEDRNYDLYKLSCRVSAKRFFPNFLNLDATFNQHEDWRADDPKRYMNEVATMGCRTRVFENRFGPKTSVGRGNISFTTINLPKIAIETVWKNGGKLVLSCGRDTINREGCNIEELVNKFLDRVLYYVDIVAKQLDERYQFQKTALKKQFPFLMNGIWINSEKLDYNETIEKVINQGTLGIGFIGLAEALKALLGKHHGESNFSQEVGLRLVEAMRQRANEWSEKLQHNYSILATPAEGLSGKFTRVDQKTYGKIEGVTDRDYYTNSNHVPVYYNCSAKHKAEVECPYHEKTRGGHIFYVEVDGDTTRNPEALMDIVELAIKNNGGYISINHFQSRCPICGFETADKDVHECPHCHKELDVLQRITGYLVGTTDRWNSGKLAELKDRVQHT